MKPKEQKSQALRQAKGLARWGWIKRYLKPAMDYVGITSEQFDEVFIGNDQFIKDRTRASPFSSPVISIMGDIYTPTGSVPPQSNNNDGFLYIEFRAAIGNNEFEPDGDPGIVYGWDGSIEFHPNGGLPRYRFYGSEQTDGTFLYVNQSLPGLGEWATIKILIASRQGGVIQLYGLRDGSAVNVALKGLQEVSVIQGLLS